MFAMIAIAAALSASISRAVAWESPNTHDILESSKAGLVKLIVSGVMSNGQIYNDYGSGFVATSSGYVISAAHLFPADLKDISIVGRLAYFKNDDARERDNLLNLELVSSDPGLDVALLKFNRNPDGLRALPIASRAPEATDEVYVLGFPGGQNLNTSYPAVYQGATSAHRFQYHGVANRGNSGGPILNRNGYVIGIVGESEDVINSTPVENIYRGVPAADLPFPKGLDRSSVRPYFLEREAVSDSVEDISLIEDYHRGQKINRCKIRIPDSWNFRKSPELGFLIAPPTESALHNADFQFEFIVRGMEYYVADQGKLQKSTRYESLPYDLATLSNQSLVLLRANTGHPESNGKEVVPIVYSDESDEYLLFRYLPRYFNKYHMPTTANSAFLMCSAKKSVSSGLFFSLCEDLLKQALEGYYNEDNPCLPGSSTP